ncbi:translocation/assembly module TamB domain-containing protein [Aquimarina algicola]|uniref:translocation/assembly module TamB domain-containing protein n=1 Tax=Aquimarina algicola TaxID=2589995 RepID=UPI001CF1ED87|nr:translocation/assembly module TamB domain-containing protein [Aquimarina algicola]
MSLFAFLVILFSIPAVQTYLGKKITGYLHETYDVNIQINRIGLTYAGNINLQEVLVKDHHNDTLLQVNTIRTSILNIKEISKGRPKLGRVYIEDLNFFMKIYKDEGSDNLMTFIRKFNSKQKSTTTDTFLLTTKEIFLKNGKYRFINENLNTQKVVEYDSIHLEAENLVVDDEDIVLNINSLSFHDFRGLNVTDLQTCFLLTPTEMNFQDLIIQTKDSEIFGEVLFSFERGGLVDFENKVHIKANFSKATVSTNDLIPFYSKFGSGQKLRLKNTLVSGYLNNFDIVNANIRGLDRSMVKGNINIKNAVSNPSEFSLEGDFENLTTNYYDLVNLLPKILGKSLPRQLYQFGSVTAKGNAIVTTDAVDIDMDLFSQLGKINAFVLLENLSDLKKASYNGNIISNNFNIGRLIESETIGISAFNIHVDGSGFTLESLDTKIEGDISKLELNEYVYTDMKARGNLRDRVFDGNLNSRDQNARFSFNGVADLSEEIRNYDFVAYVDHMDLHKLNLFTRDSISVFNGDVYMKMKGQGINDASGSISFEKTLYTNQNASYYFEDFDIRSDFDEENVRTITINSPDIVEGNVKGVFRFENVYDLFRNSIGSLYTNFEPEEVTDDEFIIFNFNIYNKIVDVFFPEIQFAPNTFIKGKVESNESEFKLTFKSPSITAFGNYMEEVNIQVDNKNPLFNTYIAIDSIDSGYYNASEFSLINVKLNDTLFMHSEFKGGKNNADNFNLEFYHTINENNKSVVGLKKSDFTYKGYTWYANKQKSRSNNKIIFDNENKSIDIKSIILSYEDEKIKVDGNAQGEYYKNLKATFENVDLNKITPRIDSLGFAGRVDGELSLLQESGNYFPTSTITIRDLNINQTLLGELKLNVAGSEDLTEYNINSKLINENNEKTFSALGDINVSKTNPLIDLNVDFNKFNISEFSALGGIVLSDMRGYVSGKAKVSGNYKNPDIDGTLKLNDVGLKIPYLNVDLDLENNAKVLLDKKRFNFDNINIRDTKYNTKGVLAGYIAHRRFSKWELALELYANDRLLVLDTEEDEESLYYGTGFIKGEAFINGPTDELVIDVNATTEKGTVFKIPLNETESIGDNSYIHFLSPEEKRARLEGKEIVLDDIKGLELNFELDVNDDAEVEIVVDKSTGSSLKGRGAGTLLIEINTNGKFNMWGDFVAYEGTYNFRYGAFVEKLFTVREGGTINWDGSPTRALLDLSAVYRTEANPAILLENASINRKIPVEVVVDLQGELVQPNVNFNIEFPNLSSVVKSELDYKLSDRANKELQALSLVSSGQFYSGTFDANAITGGLVAERASSIFNGIFSDEDDKFQVGLNYTQGARTLDQENADRFGLTLSTQINNRILLNGRVGVPIGGVNESSVVGDVEIEYLFNEDGSLRGKVFNRENDIQFVGAGNQVYEQGAGLSYSVDFDNFNELWTKIFKGKKAKAQDSIAKPKDTIKIDPPDFINFTDEN